MIRIIIMRARVRWWWRGRGASICHVGGWVGGVGDGAVEGGWWGVWVWGGVHVVVLL
jgi:hypothetical protein